MADEKKPWRREFSAGGIVYKKQDGQIFVLMINPKGRDYGPAENYWSFPKGHLESDESAEETALREIKEETGARAQVKKKLTDIKYTFKWDNDNIFKIVSYFLMEYLEGELRPDEEIANVEWVDISEAASRLKFKGDKEVLEQAKVILPSCIII
ncbi:MAG: NUDIX hydrolase [Candidatus Doudnabacteria bacterium]|nr:NUDIX hydrolase [Candidatus Doudnabacteria bacterium]